MPDTALSLALHATTPEALRNGRYDALVIGAGAAGGLAALLLAKAGLRVLVLEAGFARTPPNRSLGRVALKVLRRRQPIQSRCYAWEFDPQAFVDDIDCPYTTPPDRPFIWVRARQLGGRMMVPRHGWQYYRFAAEDFAYNDASSEPWPLRAADLDPWYEFVERRLELAGMRDNVPWLPNSELKYVLSPTSAEAELQCAIKARWSGARPVLGRFSPPLNALEAAAQTGRS